MTRKRLAAVAAATLGLALGVAAIARAPGRPALAEGTFRVAVREIVKDDRVLVAEVEVEGRPTAYVRVVSDGPEIGGGLGARLPEPPRTPRPWWLRGWPMSLLDPAPRAGSDGRGLPPSRMRLTILGDRVVFDGKDALKFQMNMGCPTCGWSGTYSTGPYPGESPLDGVLAVRLAPGTYREGSPEVLLTREGRTYRLVVDPPPP